MERTEVGDKSIWVSNSQRPQLSDMATALQGAMLNVTVTRSQWFRGKGSSRSKLLITDSEDEGKMCCLGFACIAAGLTPSVIMNIPTPSRLLTLPASLDRLLRANSNVSPSAICNKLMASNDTPVMDEPTREECIKSLGLEAGINFTFID